MAASGWLRWGGEVRARTPLILLSLSPGPPKLLEFLDVLDDPVLGYLPPTVITVLHVHLFSCAVDYRYPGTGAGHREALTWKGPAHAQPKRDTPPPGPSTSLYVSLSLPRPSPSPATSSWTPPPSCSGMRLPPPPPPPELPVHPIQSRQQLPLPQGPAHLLYILRPL